MSRFTETTIYCVAPPPNRSPAPPDNVKLVASWQTGLETPSALRQWKLRLQLVPSVMGTHSLDSINEILERLKTGRVNGRVVLAIGDRT